MNSRPRGGFTNEVQLLWREERVMSVSQGQVMRRWELSALGRSSLSTVTRSVPRPQAGEVLVKVAAVALNSRDTLVIESGLGLPLTFPFVPASDLAGTVVATGAGVRRFEQGDRVISSFAADWLDGPPPGNARTPHPTLGGIYQGVLSEFVTLPEAWLVRAPSINDVEACTLPCAGLTAWNALVEFGGVRSGQTVLVHGTGGVALFGLQIAKAHGAEVIVISGSEDKLARTRELGADHCVSRKAGDWVEEVLRITNDRGVDHVLETVGGANLGRSLQALAPNGRVACIGVQGGFELSAPIGLVLSKQATLQGISIGHRCALERFVRAVDQVALKPVIDARYSMSQLQEALAQLDRGPFGKVVIEMQ
jgi:NADPH:quinone reductase-like Zn-dependent oxidoreductase